ncbi:PREDICTED: ubiquitin carboxyl-terminal hydrolase 26-like [Chrysochloris asiatica]|uniref:Ubiquitin carboxyl-terminal hydrolase 26-like n=1 Tax=Chrysochloris asiatica TaxID=185453 RepID=A0A9B0TV38_CHRAS|nr:PREDICTED: ubiquitin carboxyl-terminal hydrolase 26-like [Chrysochloris asiatica]
MDLRHPSGLELNSPLWLNFEPDNRQVCKVNENIMEVYSAQSNQPQAAFAQRESSESQKEHGVLLCPVVTKFESELPHSITCMPFGEVVCRTELNNSHSINLSQETQSEDLDSNWDKCRHSKSLAMYKFRRLPGVLIVHLKRYIFKGLCVLKDTQKVDISIHVSLASHCIGSTKPPLPLSKRLISVDSLLGESTKLGHYVCDVCDFAQQAWFVYDELQVWQTQKANTHKDRLTNSRELHKGRLLGVRPDTRSRGPPTPPFIPEGGARGLVRLPSGRLRPGERHCQAPPGPGGAGSGWRGPARTPPIQALLSFRAPRWRRRRR